MKVYMVVINDEDISLFSSKAKAIKALNMAYKKAINKSGVTEESKKCAKEFWKLDKTKFSVDVEADIDNVYQLNGYMVEKEVQ